MHLRFQCLEILLSNFWPLLSHKLSCKTLRTVFFPPTAKHKNYNSYDLLPSLAQQYFYFKSTTTKILLNSQWNASERGVKNSGTLSCFSRNGSMPSFHSKGIWFYKAAFFKKKDCTNTKGNYCSNTVATEYNGKNENKQNPYKKVELLQNIQLGVSTLLV